MPRVVGTDPGTSRLDLLLLDDGRVADQASLDPISLRDDLSRLSNLLRVWSPIDLIAAPSGYGLPLVTNDAITPDHLDLMALVRPDERGRSLGVVGFRSWVRAFLESGRPLVFLPA